MSEETPAPYMSPQDRLNQVMSSPNQSQPTAGLDARTAIAKDLFTALMVHAVQTTALISQANIKESAHMSVDAADILIATLAKGRQRG